MSAIPIRKESTTSRVSQLSSSSTRTTSFQAAIEYAHQSERLSHLPQDRDGSNIGGAAVRVEWITPQDPIVITADGGRLPEVPLQEARKLDELHEEIGAVDAEDAIEHVGGDKLDNYDEKHARFAREDALGKSPDDRKKAHGAKIRGGTVQRSAEGSLRRSMPPSRTNPLFPPLPLYGPRSVMRDVQCLIFRSTSAVLSLAFLGVIVLGSAVTSIPLMFNHVWLRVTWRHPDDRRPFIAAENNQKKIRKEAEEQWKKKSKRRNSTANKDDAETEAAEDFVPTEGGPDPLICDVSYYARRVGLDMEQFEVQTEDGFIIQLWHIYDPKEFTPMTEAQRAHRGPEIFTGASPSREDSRKSSKKPKFPVLMMHGLLQSSGAYCTNDDQSLAFYLCKSGYDVWLGNNRCGFNPKHTLLTYSDPRMWAWNIRQMGVMDLPALVSRVLSETGFSKLGLICHSQGTTQTFVALAKEQRPELGDKITVFCALAPAAYAGPLIGKMYFKFMRVISPGLFRIFFGIHSFIPFMMTMHALLPGTLYGAMGYRVFSFLFNWTDDRWDRGLRDRMFQFAPVYVSAESMRWWLGRECFAKQKCILATKEEWRNEDREDEMDEYYQQSKEYENGDREKENAEQAEAAVEGNQTSDQAKSTTGQEDLDNHDVPKTGKPKKPKGSTAWYDSHCPPFALWVCGSDDLVDGRRLLRRFAHGREPHVKVVHAKVIQDYEHLDVIWAMDVIDQVGCELKEVLWKTAGEEGRGNCRTPVGCDDVGDWEAEGGKEAENEMGHDGQGKEEEDEDENEDETDTESIVGEAKLKAMKVKERRPSLIKTLSKKLFQHAD